MERKISFEDLRKAVNEAYNEVKNYTNGEVDARNVDVPDANAFGVSVVLTDGRRIDVGDVDTRTPMADIAKVPLFTLLLEQGSTHNLMTQMGACPMNAPVESKPKGLELNAKGVRLFSTLQPTGDFDAKWNMLETRMTDLMGEAPTLDLKAYEAMKGNVNMTTFVNQVAESGYDMYDDTAASADFYLRALNMKANTRQLATMAATIAADGVNPANNQVVFDGKLSQQVVGYMAAKGPHKMNMPWLMMAGVPAKRSWGGSMVAVYPGVMGIAAYSPKNNYAGVSVRAAAVIATIMQKLQASVFASSRVVVETSPVEEHVF